MATSEGDTSNIEPLIKDVLINIVYMKCLPYVSEIHLMNCMLFSEALLTAEIEQIYEAYCYLQRLLQMRHFPVAVGAQVFCCDYTDAQ